jgi:hypothetical protein
LLLQAIFKISVNVIKSPFTSPSKKLIGDDDGDGVVGGKPSSSSEKSSLELKEVDDLRPRHLFVEPYDGLVDEQLGTEMRTPDDLVGYVKNEILRRDRACSRNVSANIIHSLFPLLPLLQVWYCRKYPCSCTETSGNFSSKPERSCPNPGCT